MSTILELSTAPQNRKDSIVKKLFSVNDDNELKNKFSVLSNTPRTLTLLSTSSQLYGYGFTTIPDSFVGTVVGAEEADFTALTIGNSVTSIGSYAFYGCSNLSGTLTIPNSVTTIGSLAFSACNSLSGPLTIPNSVTTIGSGAFDRCSNLSGPLTLPNNLGFTTISSFAFYGCSKLSGPLTIPNSVTSIDDSAFYGCSNLSGLLTIPNSVTTIGSYAFAGCSKLSGPLTIPNSVTTIGSYAFAGCTDIQTINCYVTRDILVANLDIFLNSGIITINVIATDSSFTAGQDVIGGRTVTIVKSLI